jgi:starch synthase
VRVDVVTREYPPEVYGGAGVHVAELVRELRSNIDVQVRCFGADRDESGVTAYRVPETLADANPALSTLGVDLAIAQDIGGADVVHSHTWYANGAGHLASMLHGIPHVVTAHSLEPLRPWKAEQLGGGYRVSSWIEETAFTAADAVIAVSDGMRRDILRSYPSIDDDRVHVVHNGIDLDRLAAAARPRRPPCTRDRPRSSIGRLRRPHHPPEGPALPPQGGRTAATRGAAHPLRWRP